jgi:hypothetical protein
LSAPLARAWPLDCAEFQVGRVSARQGFRLCPCRLTRLAPVQEPAMAWKAKIVKPLDLPSRLLYSTIRSIDR